NKKSPVFTNGSIYYPETVVRKNTIDNQNLLLKLHEYSVCKSIEKYGWLLGVDLINEFLSEELLCDLDFAIKFLNNQLTSTFNQREVNVIKNIIDFLTGTGLEKEEDSLELLVTPYFYNIWETICGSLFNNEYNTLNSAIPKIEWDFSDAPVKPQRPD